MPDFSTRSAGIEIMDDLHCNGEVVFQTLRELEFINRWLGGNSITLNGVKHLSRGHEQEPLHIADLGCGSGEMLCLLAQWGRSSKLKLRFTGIDANPNIIGYAKEHCRSFPEIDFRVIDVLSPEFHQSKFDIVIGTLFYHHFSNQQLAVLLGSMKNVARIGIVINDIHRHRLAYYSIRILTFLFSRSSMVRFDAPLSVLRAFTRTELEGILKSAGLKGASIRWKWAFRWQVWHSFY